VGAAQAAQAHVITTDRLGFATHPSNVPQKGVALHGYTLFKDGIALGWVTYREQRSDGTFELHYNPQPNIF
jgi:hypothetical protein